MKKRLTALLSLIVAAAMALSACGAPPQESESPSTSEDMTVVADIDGQHIYMNELVSWLEMMGLGEEVLSNPQYKNEVLDFFVDQKVTEAGVKSGGYYDKLTEDQLSQAANYAESDIQNGMSSSGMTEEEVLAKIGMTKEELIEQYKVNIAGSAAFDEMVGEVPVSDDELKAEYDKSVADQKTEMEEDASLYVANENEGATNYYIPAGVRMVRRILIAFDEETAGAIDTLRQSGYDKQADVIRQDGLKNMQVEADAILSEITSGMSFGDALTKYSDDKDMGAEGYPVAKGTEAYSAEFTEAAMALASAGKISGLIASDEGYQILEYTSDLKQGPADFEGLKEVIRSNLQPQKQSDAWEAIVKQWRTDHGVVCYYDNLPKEEPAESPAVSGE